jgi:hypothetical protein
MRFRQKRVELRQENLLSLYDFWCFIFAFARLNFHASAASRVRHKTI